METIANLISRRPRRLRRTRQIRDLLTETRVAPDDLIAPLFVRENLTSPEPVASMPGVYRHSISGAVEECRRLRDLGIKAVALFPYTEPEKKNASGSGALDEDGLIPRTVRGIKHAVCDLVVICDVALDPYTNHGHDGVLNAAGSDVDNDATVLILAKMAAILGQAGADWVAPSDMMDGRVKAIRSALDDVGLIETAILAYSAKFNSGYYGPFRDAVGSQGAAGERYLDKGTYQLNPSNLREAIDDALLDDKEGADLLMVKPAGPYLDVISALRRETRRPIVAYQVSGEYSQIHAAARLGWLPLERVRDESLLAIKRAGADLIITYFAKTLAEKACSG